MATFKVGQRVRVLSSYSQPHIIGRAATIIRLSFGLPNHWHLDVDGFGRFCTYKGAQCSYGEDGFRLAPLADPKAEAFLESIRQLKPLPVQEIA